MAIEGVKISEFNNHTAYTNPMNDASSIFLASYKKDTNGNVNHQICLYDIKNYIDGKASNCWGKLSNDRELPKYVDLNDYGFNSAGEWFCSGNDVDETIKNKPTISEDCGNFRLIVIVNTGTKIDSWWGAQLFIETNENHWYIRKHENQEWGSWQKLFRGGEDLDLRKYSITAYNGSGDAKRSMNYKTKFSPYGMVSYYKERKTNNDKYEYSNKMVSIKPDCINFKYSGNDINFDELKDKDQYIIHSFYKGKETFNGTNFMALISHGTFLNYNGALCSNDMRTCYNASFGHLGPKGSYSATPTYNPKSEKGRFIFGKKTSDNEPNKSYLFFSDGTDWFYIPACKCGVDY